ncbi:MAG: L-histidine N(alpha)-methyltransferase [Candidatus Tyrphobacter sp.]
MSVGEATSSDRLTVVRGEIEASSFARDVREGLTAVHKSVPARYLYDEVGSALYCAVALLPEYYLTAAETEILQRRAETIVQRAGPAEIVELGPGDGRKSRLVLEAALRGERVVRYRPIDVSESALRSLSERLVCEYDRLVVEAWCCDYRAALRGRPASPDAPMLVLFLGSSIGNYAPAQACSLLTSIARGMTSADLLVLGTDLRKSRADLELAYDDPGGVTAAFNRNVLVRMNRELGANFDLSAFRLAVAYDERRGCVDSFQELLARQRVRIGALDLEVELARGERIHTESSYKYDERTIEEVSSLAGLRVSAAWEDEGGRFRLNLLQRR